MKIQRFLRRSGEFENLHSTDSTPVSVMASCSKRPRVEGINLEEDTAFDYDGDSDNEGMSSGEESELDHLLANESENESDEEFRLVLNEPGEGEEEDSGVSNDEAGAAGPPGPLAPAADHRPYVTEHIPAFSEERKMCVVCWKREKKNLRVNTYCKAPQCNRHMHIATNDKNCFELFHSSDYDN